jgi:hypothetical protein
MAYGCRICIGKCEVVEELLSQSVIAAGRPSKDCNVRFVVDI